MEQTLRTLKASDEVAFKAAVREFQQDDPSFVFAFDYELDCDFGEYVARTEHWSRGEDLPDKHVPNSYFVGVVGNIIVGRLSQVWN